MAYNFDELINRKNTRSYKWDQVGPLFGNPDILPLWVADMDFPSPPAVQEALKKRVEIGAYGYAIRTDEYADAIMSWFGRRHGWSLQREWISDSPSVVTTLSLAIEQFTAPGDKVVIQTPVYYPFYDGVRENGRELALNPLLIKNGHFEMDFEHLESLFIDGARMIMLCNPHNPGGRVWSREELTQLGELCLRYGVTVVSDEIHCDLVFPEHEYVPFASLSPELGDITITCLAATKTFNLPGLHTSFMVIPNREMRSRLDKRIKTLSIHMSHHFAQEAVIAAYNESEDWLDELLVYLKGNLDYALDYFAQHLPEVKPMKPEGTYLLWVDCRALGLDKNGLKNLMYEKAKVAFNEGSMFGTEGEGWLRINLACPRFVVEQALKQFCEAAKK